MDFYNENISPAAVTELAKRAWFSFNVNAHDDTGMDGANGVEWRLAGEGLDTLNYAIRLLQSGTAVSLFNVPVTVQLDYGSLVEDLQQVGVQNLEELKVAFIRVNGSVNRPDVFGPVYDY